MVPLGSKCLYFVLIFSVALICLPQRSPTVFTQGLGRMSKTAKGSWNSSLSLLQLPVVWAAVCADSVPWAEHLQSGMPVSRAWGGRVWGFSIRKRAKSLSNFCPAVMISDNHPGNSSITYSTATPRALFQTRGNPPRGKDTATIMDLLWQTYHKLKQTCL